MVSTFVSAGSVIIRNGGLSVNNSLYVDPLTGLVGIGTTSPVKNLDVVGTINATSQICLAGVCQSSWPSGGGGGGWTVSGNYLYNNTAGVNVGIGTASPVSLLSLYQSGSNTLLNASNGTVNAGIYVGTLSGNYAGASIGTNSNHRFNIFTGGTDRLTIDTNGYVGIGTTSPLFKLSIAGVSAGAGISINNTAANQDATIYVNDAGELRFRTNGATDRMTIQNGTGNVGIGTANPQNKLNVIGDINATGTIYRGSTAHGQAYRTATYTIAATNTWYDIPLTGGNNNLVGISHSIVTNPERISVATAGVYLITYRVQGWQTTPSDMGMVMRIVKNGVTELDGSYAISGSPASYGAILHGSVMATLAANDYITLQVGGNEATTTVLQNNNDGLLPDPTTGVVAVVDVVNIE